MLHSGELPPRVDVLECGYKREDGIYPTLTHISWKATGYQIGGNNFFGLPGKHRASLMGALKTDKGTSWGS